MSKLNYLEKLLNSAKVEWKPLKEIAKYSSMRVSYKNLNEENYVGVANLLKNRAGKTTSNYVPQSGTVTKYRKGDILIGNIGPYLKKIWHADRDGGASGDVLVVHIADQSVNARYLYQVLSGDKFFRYNMQYVKGAGIPRGNKLKIMEYRVPIPCPDDPKRSLVIQAEIVRILDRFTALTAELTAELTARKKQYNYYRDQLLTFSNDKDVEWKPLGELVTLRRGRVISTKYLLDNVGDFPVYSSQTAKSGMIGKIDTFDFDGEYITWTTDGANAGTTFHRTGKFSITNVCGLIKINEKSNLNYKFLFYWLSIEAQKHVYSGMGNPKLMSHQVEKIPIPIPYANDPQKSQAEQARIVDILDKFDALTNSISEGLPREIELRQKHYEYYRNLLLNFPKVEEGVA